MSENRREFYRYIHELGYWDTTDITDEELPQVMRGWAKRKHEIKRGKENDQENK